MQKKSILVLAALILGIGPAWTGCATRGYVRKQVDQLRVEGAQSDSTLRGLVDQTRTAADQAALRANQAAAAADTAHQLALGDSEFREAGRYRVYFAFNSAELGDAARSTLDQVAQEVQKDPRYMVGLYGFADPMGPDAYNLALGARRAQAVERYLVGNDLVQLARFQVVSFGETPPTAEAGSLGTGKEMRQVLVLLAERVPGGSAETVPRPQAGASSSENRSSNGE